MHPPEAGGSTAPAPRRRRRVRVLLPAAILVLLVGAGFVFEALTSELQSRYFSGEAAEMAFHVEEGPSDAILFPTHGPYDERLGYVALPGLRDTLEARGFRLGSQARLSEAMLRWGGRGIGPIYEEKTRAGLEVVDRSGKTLYSSSYPARVYTHFDSIPPLVVRTLLFIENRELLQTRYPHRNPAVEWDRLARAAVESALKRFRPERNVPGGSTLATQIEKFRHSAGGWTATPREKLRQIAAASLRAYLDGRDTGATRRRIVLDYVNSVPLAAAPRYGEVNGLGDGLWAWYGADLVEVSRSLREREPDAQSELPDADGGSTIVGSVALETDVGSPGSSDASAARAVAYRQVLSLFLSQRRPTYYLAQSPAALDSLTDGYLRILADAGVIDPELRDAALAVDVLPRSRIGDPRLASTPEKEPSNASRRAPSGRASAEGRPVSLAETKAAISIRSTLASLLGQEDLYRLDRLDLRATASLDSAAQREVVDLLGRLRDPAFAREAGLLGTRMLDERDLADVVYSVTLYERAPGGNLLRVQADNYPGAINLNESAKLELGSTAKLRTLAHYLEIVAELYHRHAGRPTSELLSVRAHPKDPLTRWVLLYLMERPQATEVEILNAAMARRYSASPTDRFFTGGGLHQFSNFDSKHDDQVLPVREAFRQSVNLVFIRMMRDIVHHYTYRGSGPAEQFLEDAGDTLRQAYLERFADREGSEFLRRFYRTYGGLAPEEREEVFLDGVRSTPRALAVVFRALHPDADVAQLGRFLHARVPQSVPSEATIARLYEEFAPGQIGLEDQGYLAHVHPLELWLVGFLAANPNATLREVLEASRAQRIEVYRWLFRTKRRNAQDVRIQVLLEVEAFLEVQRAWARLGYPFETMVPSYASAIGSSGDRPSALADLVGIIVGGGIRQANMRVLALEFARGTPYETSFERVPLEGERVMDPAVAEVLRNELVGVVEGGTARRALRSVVLGDGTVVPVGGKTGTGDNRIKVFDPSGALVTAKAASRTASFVFLVGDRFYGTILAYVPGAAAERYKFTSGLAVQIFTTVAPALVELFEKEEPPVIELEAEAASAEAGRVP